MNVLHVVHYPVFGGPHNQALRLAPALEKHGWHTIVLLPEEPGNAVNRLRAAGLDVVTLPLERMRARPDPVLQTRILANIIPDILRIRSLIKSRGIDLVILAGLVNPQAAIAARIAGTRLAWQIVDSRTPPMLVALLMPLVKRLANVAMFNGQSLVPLHCGEKSPGLPLVVYYPPVDTEVFKPSDVARFRTRDDLGIPHDSPIVGMVANVNPQKGIEYFIRAASIIYARHDQTRFLVVGAEYETHSGYSLKIREEIASSGVPIDRFIFTGPREDVSAIYPAMDVKVVTSVPRSEGTTTTAIEAMACGVPVVATNVGAVREVVQDGVTGCIVAPNDPAAIAAGCLTLLSDSALRQGMGHAARERAVKHFDIASCVGAHLEAFELALRAQPAVSSGP